MFDFLKIKPKWMPLFLDFFGNSLTTNNYFSNSDLVELLFWANDKQGSIVEIINK